MILDKTLILKGVAGVAAVGGAGTTYVFRKELGIVSSSDAAPDLSGLTPEEIATKKEEKKTEVNEKLKKLGLDTYCNLETTDFPNPKTLDFSKDCDLDQTKLQKIKFSNMGEGDVTVSGLDAGKTIKLKISNKKDGVKYTFSGAASKITISGSTDKPHITLKAAEEREFEEKENGSKLGKVSKNNDASTLNQKLKTLQIPNKCWFEEGESEESIDCELGKTELEKIPFSNKGNANVTVSGLDTGNIKLKIEKKNNNKLGYKFSDVKTKLTISGSADKPHITLKNGEEREFEEKENGSKLGKVAVASSDATKTNSVNTKLKNLKIPNKCWFEEEEKDYSIECEVTKDELKTLDFANKNTDDLNITGGPEGNIKLGIRRLKKSEDVGEYESTINEDDLRFIFKDVTSKITIKGKAGSDNIVIPKNSNKELHIDFSSSKLADPYSQLSSLPQNWNVYCQESGSKDCTVGKDNYIWVFGDGNSGNLQKVTISDNNQKIFDIAKDTDDYNLGLKFTVKTAVSGTPSLTANDNYEIKYSKTQKKWGFVKK